MFQQWTSLTKGLEMILLELVQKHKIKLHNGINLARIEFVFFCSKFLQLSKAALNSER